MLLEVLIVVGIFAALSYALARAYAVVANRRAIMAIPNERSAHTHTVPTPTGAGIAFLATFLFGILAFWWLQHIPTEIALALLGPVFVGAVGFADDMNPLNVPIRVALYLIGCIWSIYWVGFPIISILGYEIDAGSLGLIFGVISLIWLQNLYNFMDGIDGLATSEAAFACLGAIIISGSPGFEGWDGMTTLLLAVTLGFLVINWPTARAFMGDAGSGFLGLSLGVLALAEASVSVWVWMILLTWFLTDGCLTISIRLVRGEKIYESHSMHCYQHLTRRFGPYPVLLGVLAINIIWLLPVAWAAHVFPEWGLVLLILASLPLLVFQVLCGAGRAVPLLKLAKG